MNHVCQHHVPIVHQALSFSIQLRHLQMLAVKVLVTKSPSLVGNRNLQLTKPPIAPSMQHQQQQQSNYPSSNQNGTAKSGRTLMSYGGQRSATTSIVTTTSSNLQQPQPRMTPLQKQFAKQQNVQPPQLPSGLNGYHANGYYLDLNLGW